MVVRPTLILVINLVLGISLVVVIVGLLAWAIRTAYRDTISLFESPFREIVTQFYKPIGLRLRGHRAVCEYLCLVAIFPLRLAPRRA